MDKEDIQKIRKYTSKSEKEKAIKSLIGILEGISIDNSINIRETHELKKWCGDHSDQIGNYPFSEIIPKIFEFIDDGILDLEECEDILWLCRSLSGKSKYYDVMTNGIQELEGVLGGILADGIITDKEIFKLKDWLSENNGLLGIFPYDEINENINNVLSDGKIDDTERMKLELIFSQYTDIEAVKNKRDDLKKMRTEMQVSSIFEIEPKIVFENNLFCFTGASQRAKKAEIGEIIINKGGRFTEGLTKKTNYLLIGNNGNPCWAYSNYGRKIENAINMKKEGIPILLIDEDDFWKVV